MNTTGLNRLRWLEIEHSVTTRPRQVATKSDRGVSLLKYS